MSGLSADCCQPAPPAVDNASGKEEVFAGLPSYVTGSPSSSAAVLFATDVFGKSNPESWLVVVFSIDRERERCALLLIWSSIGFEIENFLLSVLGSDLKKTERTQKHVVCCVCNFGFFGMHSGYKAPLLRYVFMPSPHCLFDSAQY